MSHTQNPHLHPAATFITLKTFWQVKNDPCLCPAYRIWTCDNDILICSFLFSKNSYFSPFFFHSTLMTGQFSILNLPSRTAISTDCCSTIIYPPPYNVIYSIHFSLFLLFRNDVLNFPRFRHFSSPAKICLTSLSYALGFFLLLVTMKRRVMYRTSSCQDS